MNICLVTHTAIKGEGQGRANYEITNEAICRGYRVTVLAREVAPELKQSPLVTWIPIRETKLPTQLLRNLAISWQNNNWLRKHRQEFDLLIVNGAISTSPWRKASASVKADLNLVHFVHSSWLRRANQFQISDGFKGIYQWFYTWLNSQWEVRSFQDSQVLVAVSPQVEQELLEFGIPPDKIRVILNGVDLEEFYPGSSYRSALGIPEQVPMALFVGELQTSRKNLDTVLRALKEVPQLHLAVLGKTVGSPYPQLTDQLGLRSRVHFLEYRQDVAQIMRSVDLFVFPSRYEPFGLVVTEAMASGLPVITAQTVGASDLVNPECGFVLNHAEDVETLAQALNHLVQEAPKRKQMGQAARAIAEKHSWSSKAKSYLDLFEELISPNTVALKI
jgi:glycosyltransferase involved in cell wall biosynthesis